VAACIECGRLVCAGCRTVADDGLCWCAECLAAPLPMPEPERTADPPSTAHPPAAADRSFAASPTPTPIPSGPGGPTPIPWEHPENRDIVAFAQTVREALLGPSRYMGSIPWLRGDLRTPLLFAVLASVLGQLGLMLQTAFIPPLTPTGGLAALPPGMALATAPLLPLLVTVALFLKALAAHAMLRVAGSPPRPFEATFRVYAYAEVASLLLIVPWVGPYAARFYVIFLLLTGLRFAQGAGFSASLLAMAPTLLLMWVLV
jgi:hypothetical protein